MVQAPWVSRTGRGEQHNITHLHFLKLIKCTWLKCKTFFNGPLRHTHCCSKFDRYGVGLLCQRTAHAKAYLGDFTGCWWVFWGFILILGREMLGCAFDCCPFSPHIATRDRLSFHSAFLLLRPCLRQDNSPWWTTVSCELENNINHLYHLYLRG